MRIVPMKEFSLKRDVDTASEQEMRAVDEIVAAVRQEGDAALRRFTMKFDNMTLKEMEVTQGEMKAAYTDVSDTFLEAIREAAANIRSFHEKQKRTSWNEYQPNGTILGQLIRPLQRIGVYVPGGKAAYPSSVLMNVIPAKVAGVEEIVMVTPPGTAGGQGIDPHVLVAAAEAGVTEMYRVGGAQAVAALAHGTETIRRVDKIVGPGNIYVALAKRRVFGLVDIDSIAGPSEIVIVADETADPDYAAADLLSQAEHDELASAVLITHSEKLAVQVKDKLEGRLARLARRDIASRSIDNYGAIVLTADVEESIRVSNQLAPEHLELMIKEPFDKLGSIHNAGAIFLGPYSSEPVGDYFAGPNHILPTNGTARFSSPLNVDDFIKKSSIIHYSRQALLENGQKMTTLARQEGLDAHAEAIEIRLEKEGGNQ